ncbi:MAG: hypothetical protein KBG15_17440 [Kofleriaceae bacterium]|nr:hypothetical protein [Kofleriaceae bacterium]
MRTCLILAILVACKAGPTPTRATPPTAAPALGEPLAKKLAGPFKDLDAYCATLAKKSDEDCERVPVRSQWPFLGAELIYRVVEHGDFGCALGLQTATGWYVSLPGEWICREPSYREMTGVTIEYVDVDQGLTAVHVDVHWATKGPYRGDGDAEADYRYTSLCGIVGDVPACTSMFQSRCEYVGSYNECGEDATATVWKIEGNTVTFNRRTEQTPAGRHLLLPAAPPEPADD